MINRTFRRAIILSILLLVAIAFFDILSAQSGVFGTLEEYSSGRYTKGWWPLYYNMVLILMVMIPISYFFFGRRDKSEAFALFINSFLLFWFGLADILYFWLQGRMVPATLPWLNNSPVIGKISSMLGNEVVTSTSLYISAIVGFIIVFILDKWLEKIN